MPSRVALVTGGASGIGRAVAAKLAKEGHRVAVADMDAEGGREAADEIGGAFLKVDLSNRDECRGLVGRAAAELGPVEILINNAGFQRVASIENFEEKWWDGMMAVMLTAPFLLTKHAWPSMKARGWGRVVNIASIHAQVASPHKVGYITAKHGLVGLTRTAALEGGEHGITVNAICPAYVRTPLVEGQIAEQAKVHGITQDEVVEKVMLAPAAVKRLIEPDEVAGLVAYLCSDSAGAVTGASWAIDLGWTAR